MSDTDSFIDEVSEEVRRDRLYKLMRRYGWIPLVAVVAIVGGAAFSEYRKGQAAAKAQALGDNVLAALETEDDTARIEALSAIEADTDAAAIVALFKAAEAQGVEDPKTAAATLQGLVNNPELPQNYRDLAAVKLLLVGGDVMPEADRSALLTRLSAPGGAYRPVALELQVYELVKAGKVEEAIAAANALLNEPDLTPALQLRVAQLIQALGGTVNSG